MLTPVAWLGQLEFIIFGCIALSCLAIYFATKCFSERTINRATLIELLILVAVLLIIAGLIMVAAESAYT